MLWDPDRRAVFEDLGKGPRTWQIHSFAASPKFCFTSLNVAWEIWDIDNGRIEVYFRTKNKGSYSIEHRTMSEEDLGLKVNNLYSLRRNLPGLYRSDILRLWEILIGRLSIIHFAFRNIECKLWSSHMSSQTIERSTLIQRASKVRMVGLDLSIIQQYVTELVLLMSD